MSKAFKLSATCTAVMAVFPVTKDKRVEGGPVLTGTIKENAKAEVSYQVAFFPANWKNKEVEGFSIKVQTNEGKASTTVCYGAAFKRKVEDGSKAPNYGIVLNIAEGEILSGALWKQEPKDKESKVKSYLSGNLSPVDKAKSTKTDSKTKAGAKAAPPADDMDDDIPF